MRLKHKYKVAFKVLGFIFLLGAMVVLNEHQEAASKTHKAKQVITTEQNDVATNAITAPVPARTESALPLKLIYNPNSDFLLTVNQGNERLLLNTFVQQEHHFLRFCCLVNKSYLIKFLATTHNKDIQ